MTSPKKPRPPKRIRLYKAEDESATHLGWTIQERIRTVVLDFIRENPKIDLNDLRGLVGCAADITIARAILERRGTFSTVLASLPEPRGRKAL